MEIGTGPRELFWYLGPVPDTNRDCELLSQIYQICQKIRVNLEYGAAKSLCSQHEVIWVEVK